MKRSLLTIVAVLGFGLAFTAPIVAAQKNGGGSTAAEDACIAKESKCVGDGNTYCQRQHPNDLKGEANCTSKYWEQCTAARIRCVDAAALKARSGIFAPASGGTLQLAPQ